MDLMLGGIRVALITTIAGCMVFVLSQCAWTVLRWVAARRLPTEQRRRLALLEEELQILRGELQQVDERSAFFEKLRAGH